MKKTIKITLAVLAVLLLSGFTLPFLFKDKIKRVVNEAIQKQVNAQVYYGDLGLSLFSNFPNLTVSLSDFGVVGRSPFVGDTLVQAKDFDVSFNLKSLWSDTYQVNSLSLDQPKISVIVLKNGQANYDIMVKDTLAKVDTAQTKLNLNVDSWQISDGTITYDDKKTNTYASFEGIEHSGKGNLKETIFDLASETLIQKANLSYNNTQYLKDKRLEADLTLGIDQAAKKYTFKDNSLKINDFLLNVKGWLQQPDTSKVMMDLAFDAPEGDFKNILSLVPNIYTEKFGNIKAEGKFAFDGHAKGTYQGQNTPAFGLNLTIDNGQFQYPDLPTPVTGVNMNLKVKNQTSSIDNTIINLEKLTAKLGSNPIDARALIEGLKSRKIDADVVAKLNLEEVSKIFPVEGLAMRGLYDLKLKAKGVSDGERFPVVNALMALKNGYIKSNKFPEPIENLNVLANVVNTSGQAADTKITLNDLKMVLAGEAFAASGIIENLKNYTWDIKAKGRLDLTKITQIYPLTDMSLKGKIDADIQTKGQMADVKAKRYGSLPTSGTATVQNLEFVSKAYPQGFRILTADLAFTPQEMKVSKASGFLGKSDFVGNGSVNNYIGYALNDEVLKGRFDVSSQTFNVNEWMTDKPKSESQPLRVVEVPKNIDFQLNADVKNALYDKMTIREANGNITIGNGTIKMQNVAFSSLGGRFSTNGTYDPRNLEHPKFDFNLSLESVEIPQAYQNLSIVRTLLPLAQYAIGEVSSKFSVAGELQQDMMPNMTSLSGEGILKVLKASVSGENNVIARLSEMTKLKSLQNLQLKDVLMKANITDGKLNISPFDIKIDDTRLNVGGSNTLTGAIDYNLKLDVPTGKVGQAFNSTFTAWTGKTLGGTDRVKFDIKMTGTITAPKFTFSGSPTANALKDAVAAEVEAAKAKALDEANKLKAQAEAEVTKLKNEGERLKAEAEAKLQAEKERLIKEAEAKKVELENKAKAYADSIKKVAQERAKQELEKQKNNILNGLFKKKVVAPKDSTR
jgi:hypothetical protein